MEYAGKKFFITGGSEGIGRSIAVLLAGKGADVFVFSRSQQKIAKALKDIQAVAGDDQVCEGVPLDVTDHKKVESVFASLIKKHGTPDVLINAAGYAYPQYFEKIPVDQFHQMMEVNYMGIVHTCKAIVPYFQKAGGGHIVNTSSLAAVIPTFGYSGYTGTKAAIVGLSEVLREEMKRYNIKVSVLLPPDTDTPGFKVENKTKPEETKEISKSAKMFTPDEVAIAFEKGFRKNRFMIVVGFEGKLAYRLHRYTPGILNSITYASVKKVHKRRAKAAKKKKKG